MKKILSLVSLLALVACSSDDLFLAEEKPQESQIESTPTQQSVEGLADNLLVNIVATSNGCALYMGSGGSGVGLATKNNNQENQKWVLEKDGSTYKIKSYQEDFYLTWETYKDKPTSLTGNILPKKLNNMTNYYWRIADQDNYLKSGISNLTPRGNWTSDDYAIVPLGFSLTSALFDAYNPNNLSISFPPFYQCIESNISNNSIKVSPNYGGIEKKHLWKIVPIGEFEIVSIKYSLSPEDVAITAPSFITTTSAKNNSSEVVQQTVSYTMRTSETSTFTKTMGFTVSLSASVSVGVPILVNGQINTTMTSSNTWQYGTSETKDNSETHTLTVRIPPYKILDVKAIVERKKISADYEAVLRSKVNGALITVKGKWSGTQSTNSYYEITEREIYVLKPINPIVNPIDPRNPLIPVY